MAAQNVLCNAADPPSFGKHDHGATESAARQTGAEHTWNVSRLFNERIDFRHRHLEVISH